MRFSDLSRADQELLQSDLGNFDKVAAEQVALIDEMYSTGFNKLAAETADMLDKLAEEELDEEGEKTAAVCGAWTERGFFDGLAKLGADRHGDELYYLAPFIEEKIAGKAKGLTESVVGAYNKVKGAVVNNHRIMKSNAQAAYKGKGMEPKNWNSAKPKKGQKMHKLTPMERAQSAGHAALRASPYALGAGAIGLGGYKLVKKDDGQE